LASWQGTGFEWYDTFQAHIVTNITFRRCGARGEAHQGVDGCGDGVTGCHATSSVWSFLTHSDEHVPEFMQATAGVRYEACGRRFRMHNYVVANGGTNGNGMQSTVSERYQSWLDADGSAAGSDRPTIMASAVAESGEWWQLDGGCARNEEGPLWMCERRGLRQLGSVNLAWDAAAHGGVGWRTCANGAIGVPCVPLGWVTHWGFGSGLGAALPLTANGQITGVLGGFGWHISFEAGSPRALRIDRMQVSSQTALVLSIPYPRSVTSFRIAAHAPPWCSASATRACTTSFRPVSSLQEVRASAGDVYHWADGLLYLRLVQPPADFTGAPSWSIVPDSQLGASAVPFRRHAINIFRFAWHAYTLIEAECAASAANPAYCADPSPRNATPPQPCPAGWSQTAFDQCCSGTDCIGPGGAHSAPLIPLVLSSPPPTAAAPTPTPPPTCALTMDERERRCACRHVWEGGSPVGERRVCR